MHIDSLFEIKFLFSRLVIPSCSKRPLRCICKIKQQLLQIILLL